MAAGRAHLWITGFVQGVSFRYYTHQQAVQLGLVGWVRNLTDEVYWVDVINLTVFQESILYAIGDPRTYGISVTVRF